MSLLNLGLQAVGLMRSRMPEEELEKIMKACNTMSDVREAVKQQPALKAAIQQSLNQPVELLTDVFTRLSLKDKPVQIGEPASADEMDELWTEMQQIDDTLQQSDSMQAKITSKKDFVAYLEHCSQRHHYFFSLKKCGEPGCSKCGPTVLPPAQFAELHPFLHPIPVSDQDKYQPFEEV